MTDPRPNPDATWRLDVVASGRVQGVGYRYFVVDVARTLGLTGWVSNEPDGSVRCVAEGRRPNLERLLDELRVGPASALVDDVRATWSPAAGSFAEFGIRWGSHRGD